MKLNKLFIVGGIAAASLSLGSCLNDLDLTPTDPTDITQGKFSDDPEGYMRRVMADIYINISSYGFHSTGENILTSMDGGMSTFQRAVFNLEEVPSDEADWMPLTDKIPWTFQFGEITVSDPVIMGVYSRFMVISSLCNQFIQTDFQINTLPEEKRQAVSELREEFVRQAKILRSGMYFYLVSEYGNVPYNDENVLMGDVAPQLSTDYATGRRLVTERVVDTLEDIVAWYKQNDPSNNPPYGYVGLDVAEALLVKFYLNYEVFTGTPAWDKCLDHAQAIIGRRGVGGWNNTGLAKNYFHNFSPNNVSENEIIWRIVGQNADTHTDAAGNNSGIENYANGGFMLCGFAGAQNQNYYNTGNGWSCMVAREQLVDAFDWTDAECSESPDIRVKWWYTSKFGFPKENTSLVLDDYGSNGYAPVKFVNWYLDDNGDAVPELTTWTTIACPGIDYGMIRLAEIYLSAAEAILNGAGSNEVALRYVNYIRERAGLDPYTSINMAELQQERQRELYTECTRRTDLVRYGKWVSGYNWAWKYHVREGHDFPANMIVYPLPSTVVITNGYEQNEPWK